MMDLHWYESYVGLPWKLGGRDHAGLDCWGLIRLAYKEQLGCELPSFLDDPHALAMTVGGRAKAFKAHLPEFYPVPEGSEQPFDIATMKLGSSLWHVGLLVSKPFTILHIEDEEGCKIEDWSRREDFIQFGGFYRVRK